MKIVELQQDSIVTLRFYAYDVDELAAEDEALRVAAAMALYLRTRAFNAQVFGRQFRFTAVVPFDVEDLSK